jgi:hypothetical protein
MRASTRKLEPKRKPRLIPCQETYDGLKCQLPAGHKGMHRAKVERVIPIKNAKDKKDAIRKGKAHMKEFEQLQEENGNLKNLVQELYAKNSAQVAFVEGKWEEIGAKLDRVLAIVERGLGKPG